MSERKMVGQTEWAIAEGYIPPESSNGDDPPRLDSRQPTLALLSTMA